MARASHGRGLKRNVPRYAPWASLFDFTTWPSTARAVAHDWYFAGRGPARSTDIPWGWLSGPLRFRPDSPLNAAQVTISGGSTAYADDDDSIDEYGQWGFTHTTYSANAKDAANLAAWIVAYYTDPRVRLAQAILVLNKRTDSEIRRILGREVGDRVSITGTPTGWPGGAIELVIEGINHSSAADLRVATWSLSPLIGENPDESGPWFRLGVSQLGGDDALPW